MKIYFSLGRAFYLGAVIFAAVSSGCGKPGPGTDKIAATVNGQAVYARDLEKELSFKSANDPLFRVTPQTLEDHLRMMIDKRILIQEAKKNKLDEKEKFIHTIKLFWEQTLIRDLIQAREAELARSASVTEEEARHYYGNLSYQVTLDVLKNRDREVIKKSFGLPVEQVPWDEEIGPVSFDDLSSGILARAFELQAGEKRIYEGDGFYYLVFIKKKEKVARPPYEQLEGQVKEKIRALKVQEAFTQWLDGLKSQSAISIDQAALTELGYRYDRTEK